MGSAARGPNDYYASGDWNAVCYECGRKFKASQLKRHWQGYYVCAKHWEPRHPQDFVRGVQDVQTPPWTQPMPAPAPAGTSTVVWVNDRISVYDTLARSGSRTISMSDTIPVSDAAGRSVLVRVGDSVAVTDAVTVNTPNHRTVSLDDTVAVSDAVSVTAPAHYVQNLTDTVSVSDSIQVTAPQHYVANVADYITPSDNTAVQLTTGGINPINSKAVNVTAVN